MCRSIQTLRPPFHDEPTDEEIRAAALQYVRKVSGFRTPAAHNAQVFQQAVDAITAATEQLLDGLVVKGSPGPEPRSSWLCGRSCPCEVRPPGAS